jgi:glycolate oxidase
LHRLFVGSEGLLGIVTEATLKLIPLPPFRANLAVGFGSMKNAVRAVQSIFAAGFLPCALELADEFTLAAAAKRTGSKRLGGCKAHLIVELDGQKKSVRGEIAAVEKSSAHKPFHRARARRTPNAKKSGNPPRIFLLRSATPA